MPEYFGIDLGSYKTAVTHWKPEKKEVEICPYPFGKQQKYFFSTLLLQKMVRGDHFAIQVGESKDRSAKEIEQGIIKILENLKKILINNLVRKSSEEARYEENKYLWLKQLTANFFHQVGIFIDAYREENKIVVLSVPFNYPFKALNLLKEAAQMAKVSLAGFIDEPLAILLSYDILDQLRTKENILIIDGGDRELRFYLMEWSKGSKLPQLLVKSYMVEPGIGGSSIFDAILRAKAGSSVTDLRHQFEEEKEIDLHFYLTARRSNWLEKIRNALTKFFEKVEYKPEDVNTILVSGGIMEHNLLIEELEKYFKAGKPSIYHKFPFNCVAKGACIAALNEFYKEKKLPFAYIKPWNIGVDIGGEFYNLIPFEKIPKTGEVYETARAFQVNFEGVEENNRNALPVDIYYGGSPWVSGNTKLAELGFFLEHKDETANKIIIKLELQNKSDAFKDLTITLKDANTGKSQEQKLQFI